MSSVSASSNPTAQSLASPRLSRWREVGLLVVLSVGLSVIALLIRWPYLQLVPRLTDETAEVQWAIRIARGEILPLTHTDTYDGPLQPYLLAGLFRLFGLDPSIPRAIMAVLGAALAGVVAWLAWAMSSAGGCRPSAVVSSLIAGALVATSFPLVVVNSHIAWSNGLTPLFTILALGVTWSAVVQQRGWRLVLAGFLWGLALQTHPSVVALLPGVALWIVLYPKFDLSPSSASVPSSRPLQWRKGTGDGGNRLAWLKTRWPWLALGAFLLGYGNMLWYNLTTLGSSVDEAVNPRNAYTIPSSLGDYLAQVGDLLGQLARMLAGAYTIQPDGSITTTVTPMVVVYGVVALLALAWAARRPSTAILSFTAVSGALILPLVSHAFTALYDTRYIAFLLPLVYIAIGLAVGDVIGEWRLGIGRWGMLAGSAVMVVYPLLPLANFYRDSEAYGLTNRGLLELVAATKREADQGTFVLLDRDMRTVKLGGGGDPVRALEHLFTLDGIPNQTARPDTINWYLLNSEAPMLLVLSDATYADLSSRHNLAPTAFRADGFAAYRAPKAK